MIGVVIPAHNEQDRLHRCLASVFRASLYAGLRGETVCIAVVLDKCTDNSAQIVNENASVVALRCEANNVGIARAAGANHLLRAGARWLAFTDADTVVSEQWLAMQLSLGAQAVCGTVSVSDWDFHGITAHRLQQEFLANYHDCEGHRHVHGANLGLSACAYRKAGGFQPLSCHEDQALVDALVSAKVEIAWSNLPRVFTSARLDPRAHGGFGDYLVKIVKQLRHSGIDDTARPTG